MNIEEAKKYIRMIIRKKEIPDSAKALGYVYAEESIETILSELDKKDKVIDMMAEYIEEWIGSCPNDMYDWQEIDCEKECETSMKKCWIEYFYNKVEIPEKN